MPAFAYSQSLPDRLIDQHVAILDFVFHKDKPAAATQRLLSGADRLMTMPKRCLLLLVIGSVPLPGAAKAWPLTRALRLFPKRCVSRFQSNIPSFASLSSPT